jgi:hypothetical protein
MSHLITVECMGYDKMYESMTHFDDNQNVQ